MPFFTNRGITPLPTAAAYAGPGDVVSGAAMWGGLRAYSAAQATGAVNALQLDNASSTDPRDIKILATGFLDTVTAAPLVGTYRVSKLYDQTGNGNHWAQTTHTQRPSLNVSGTPFMLWDNSDIMSLATTATFTQSQPFSHSMVVQRVTNFTTQHKITQGNVTGRAQVVFASSADTMGMYSGSSVPTFTATDAAFHAVQAVFDNASQSIGYVDGTTNNVSLGTSNGYAADGIAIGSGAIDIRVREFGVWFSAFSAANMLALNTNQHGTSGWNF